MNNDELKKKIAQIIADYFCPQRNKHKNLWGDDRLCYSKMNFAECERVTECTDALIAAGIGDVAALTDKWREMLRVQAEKTEQAERRARIAEFALYRSFGPHSYGFELQRAEQILSESGELAEEKKEP